MYTHTHLVLGGGWRRPSTLGGHQRDAPTTRVLWHCDASKPNTDLDKCT